MEETSPSQDFDGIDGMIKGKGEKGQTRNIRVEFQAKCTHTLYKKQNGDYSFSLDVDTYDKLRVTDDLPAMLIIMRVPKNMNEWVTVDDTSTILKHHAYWVSLMGHGESASEKTITINIKKENILDSDTLTYIMNDPKGALYATKV